MNQIRIMHQKMIVVLQDGCGICDATSRSQNLGFLQCFDVQTFADGFNLFRKVVGIRQPFFRLQNIDSTLVDLQCAFALERNGGFGEAFSQRL